MEIFGKKGRLRLLAGLLAIFVTLYFTADLFGGIRADDGSSTLGESGELDEEPAFEAEEIFAEENGIMLLALANEPGNDQSMLSAPFQITKVDATINGAALSENGVAAVKNKDSFSLAFEWQMTDNNTHAFETFSYDLSTDLQGIKLKNTTPPGEPVDYTGDGVNDAYYEVNNNVLTLRILDTKNYTGYKGGFTISGEVDLSAAQMDANGQFTISFANKTFDLVDSVKASQLDVTKSRVGSVTYDNGAYWQEFSVTVTNKMDSPATNVRLVEQYGELFTGDVQIITISNGSTGSSFPLDLGMIDAKGSVTVTYKMKLDREKMVSGQGNSNIATLTADNLLYPPTGWANADYNFPSFQKKGELINNGADIEWTIEIKPGFMENEDWSVTDRGETWAKSDAGWSFNGTTYTRTFTTTAPAPDKYTNKSEPNEATFTDENGYTKKFSASVTIYAEDQTNYIAKTHDDDAIKVIGDEIRIPWAVSVTIPDEEVTWVKITDELTNAWSYVGHADQIEILFNTMRITDGNGNVYSPSAPTVNYEKCVFDGIGPVYETWAKNVGFELQIKNDQNFLTQNRNKTITITYDLAVKDPTISAVTNRAALDLTFKNNTTLPTQNAINTHRQNVAVTKEPDYGGPASQYKNYAHSWKVTVTNNSGSAASGPIKITDTLPAGYVLCAKDGGGYELTVTDPSGTPVSYTLSGETTSTFTVTVDQAYSNQSLTLYYTAQMTDTLYQSVSTTQNATFTYTNTVEAELPGVGKGTAEDTFSVYTSNSKLLSKSVISEDPNISNGEFRATYRIEVNEDKEDKGGDLTVEDTLGTALELVESSVKVYKLTGSNKWEANDWTDVTGSVTSVYDPSSRLLTVTPLENMTYYKIEYDVTGTALRGNELTNTNAVGVSTELKKRFENRVELKAGGKGLSNTSIELSDNYYRQGGFILFNLKIEGTKDWKDIPAGTAQPTDAEFELQRTETKITGTETYETYTFRLEKGRVVPGTSSGGGFQPDVQNNGADWSFVINSLMLRDATIGSDYTYQLSEITPAGYDYDVSYVYRTDPAAGWTPVADASVGLNSGAILQSNTSGWIGVQITNTYTESKPAKPVVSEVSIDKKDMTGAEQLEGAQLTIRNTGGTSLSGVTVTGAKNVTQSGSTISFTTTDQRATVKGLPEGSYVLEEKVAPNGYTITTPFSFKIDDKGNVTATGTSNGNVNVLTGKTITLKDQAIKLTIRKTDKGTGRLLAGAEFTLTAASPSADLSNINVEGATVDLASATQTSFSFTTRASDVTIEGIPAGTYTLEETKAPNRYKKSGSGKITFTVSTNGSITGYPNNTITVQNEIITAELTVKKTDNTGAALTGAAFTLTAGSATDWTGVTFGGTPGSGNGTSYKFTVDDSLTIKGLPIGKYTLTETKAPSGYLLTGPFPFEVTNTGAVTSSDSRYAPANKTVTLIDDQPQPGTIEILKTDLDDGTLLPGAEFALTRKDGGEIDQTTPPNNVNAVLSADRKTLTFTTTDQPAQITGLAAGDYVITETKAPSGYILSAAPQNVELIDNGTFVSSKSVSIENDATEVSINKVDMTGGGKQLEGAELTITSTDNYDLSDVTVTGADSVTPSGSTISFTTTGETATIKRLPEGDYVLEEKVAPSGYTVTTKFYFTIAADGTVTETSGSDNYGNTLDSTRKTINLDDKPTEILIKKVDMANSAQLPGATLLIRGKRGADFSNVKVSGAASSRVDKVNARVTLVTGNADAAVQGLPAGDYELTETIAPTGYEKTTTTFSFKIGTDGKVTVNTMAEAGGSDIELNGNTITVKDEPQKVNPDNPDDPNNPNNTDGPNNPSNTTATSPQPTGSNPGTSGGSNPQPTGSRPSGGTRPTGTTAPTIVTTAPTAATTTPSRSTLTEPDEIEPEKTTSKTTAKTSTETKKTKKTTTAPENDLPKTTEAGTERTDIAIGVNQVTRDPGLGLDSNLTVNEENPNTGVSLTLFTPLAAVFAAAGVLATGPRKKKKK